MTETSILDDKQIAELESQLDEGVGGLTLTRKVVVRALCATVKDLRDDAKSKKIELLQLSGRGDLLTKAHVKFDDLDEVAAVRNEFDRLRNIVIVELQSQLEQLRGWKESAMALLARYDSIAETFGGKLGSSKIDNLERGVEQLRAENGDLRKDNENLSGTIFNNQHAQFAISRAIQLCKDKAAEWEQSAGASEHEPEGYNYSLCKRDAATELATELEKL